jgi:Tfp pilus assembly protein PilX
MREKNKKRKINQERGVALFFVLFALLLLSAIAASLVLMTNTETSVNANYRNERVADYAAKAGFEEVRARMRVLDPGSISANLPTVLPSGNNFGVLYVLNEGNAPGTVQPWNTGTAYMDDELCHDSYNYNGYMQQQQASLAPDLRCTRTPNGGGWYNTVTSNAPYSGTSAALPYKWVRVALKVNCTVQNAQNPTSYCVNAAQPAGTQVCWNGGTEVLLSGVGVTKCQNMTPSTNPVYVITSLAVTGVSTRKMVQAEVALDPAQPFPYGLYATGNSCAPPALNLHGGGTTDPFTDSFTTANGGTYATTNTPTGGDVGSNGGVGLSGHAEVGGLVSVLNQLASPPAPANPCIGPTGDYVAAGANAGPFNPNGLYPQNTLSTMVQPYTFPTPADPVPMPPATPYTGGPNLVPGTYGAITLTGGTLTLAPGTYNIYSLNISGGSSSITVNPPGSVVLNFPAASAAPISITGQGIVNPTLIANDFQINYGGTGVVFIAGKGKEYCIVDAPNAAVQVEGNGDTFGRIIGRTIDYGGNGKFHFDKASALGPPNNGPYTLISFRDVAY